MSGKITISELDAEDEPHTPVGLQFGITQSEVVPPVVSQMSNVFLGLENGTYYVWYRAVNSAWNSGNVLEVVVHC